MELLALNLFFRMSNEGVLFVVDSECSPWLGRLGVAVSLLIYAVRCVLRLSAPMGTLTGSSANERLHPAILRELRPRLEPVAGLRRLFEDEWECLDHKPQFEVVPPWPKGYVHVACLLCGDEQMRVRFTLGRGSRGDELQEREPSSKAYQRTADFSTVLYIDRDVQRLRFSPCDRPMRIHISQFRITQISRIEYARRMLQARLLPLSDRVSTSLNHAVWAWDYMEREGLKAAMKRALEILESARILLASRRAASLPLPVAPGPWEGDLLCRGGYSNRSGRCVQTVAASPKDGPRRVSRVAIHVSPHGNYFFREIALLFHAAFSELGADAIFCDRYQFVDAEDRLHFIVAPHEYFLLAQRGSTWNPFPRERTVVYNTEQLQTSWYKEASKHLDKGFLVLDLDASTAEAQRSFGLPCEHVPLGYCPSLELFSGLHPVPLNSATLALAPEVREWKDRSRSLRDRPVDLIFFGRNTPRRGEFFARHARFFADYRCFFRIDSMQDPLHPGINTPIDTETTTSLSRRAKISLNIHRDESRYFEWHRIAVLSIWQETLVVSEPSTLSAPFVPGLDYVEAEMDLIPAAIEYLLRSGEGMRHAERIRQHARKTFFERCLLRNHLMHVFKSEGISIGSADAQ